MKRIQSNHVLTTKIVNILFQGSTWYLHGSDHSILYLGGYSCAGCMDNGLPYEIFYTGGSNNGES